MNRKRYILCLAFILICASGLRADWPPDYDLAEPVYRDTSLTVITVTMDPDSLAWLLEWDNRWNYRYLPADMIFQNSVLAETLYNVGIRLRGNTSRSSAKKSFKLKPDAFESGQKLSGLDQLNLNGEHNDPSITRSRLCWHLFEALHVPASRAAHARLYINGEYRGLYVNVEGIDKEFLRARFGDDSGNLYKCLWPADLVYISNNPDDYKFMQYPGGGRPPYRTYDLQTNEEADDYSDLRDLIKILHDTPDGDLPVAIREIFDVEEFLRYLATNTLTGMWDDYWYNKNNFYLYHNMVTGRFEFIPYDYDNTYGIAWDSNNWGTRNVYTWGNNNYGERPLVHRILNFPAFKNTYTYFLNELLADAFTSAAQNPEIDSLKNRLYDAAFDDVYRTYDYGFSFQDFLDSYDQDIPYGHVHYGLKPYVAARNPSALSQLNPGNIPPWMSQISHAPQTPRHMQPVTVTVFAWDDMAPPSMKLFHHTGGAEDSLVMYDDGAHGDGLAGDSVFGATIPGFAQGINVRYRIRTNDGMGQIVYEPPSMTDHFIYSVGAPGRSLFINEFMADNDNFIMDLQGDYDDWLEIYNDESEPINLAGMTLTDNFALPEKWTFPDTVLQPGGYLVVWCDEDVNDAGLHANFKLSKEGEEIGLYDDPALGGILVDSITFGLQTTDVSYGRVCDSGLMWAFFDPATPGAANSACDDTVQNLTVIRDGDGIRLFWEPITWAVSYTIYRSSTQPVNLETDSIGVTTDTYFLDTGVFPAIPAAFYRVTARP